MQHFFCNIYNKIPDNDNKIIKLWYSLLRRIVRVTANILLPVYYRKTNNSDDYRLNSNKDAIIVSLTSFPTRISTLWLCIESILRQSVKPDKIILWLSKEQFPTMTSIPTDLTELQKRGLEIRLVDGDIKSHKKYYYVFNEYPESIIITIDDDIIYNDTLIEELLKEHSQHRKDIICAYSRIISYTESGELKPYKKWKKNEGKCQSNLFFGSGGGTLFPAHSLYKDLLNIELAKKLTPTADDIWLNAMARLNQTRIRAINKRFVILPIIIHKNIKLSKKNFFGMQNDVQINNIRQHYIDQQTLFTKENETV